MVVKKYNEDKEVTVQLTLSQVKNVSEFIELYLLDVLRKDEDIDNILYVSDMCDACKKLKEVFAKNKEERPNN